MDIELTQEIIDGSARCQSDECILAHGIWDKLTKQGVNFRRVNVHPMEPAAHGTPSGLDNDHYLYGYAIVVLEVPDPDNYSRYKTVSKRLTAEANKIAFDYDHGECIVPQTVQVWEGEGL